MKFAFAILNLVCALQISLLGLGDFALGEIDFCTTSHSGLGNTSSNPNVDPQISQKANLPKATSEIKACESEIDARVCKVLFPMAKSSGTGCMYKVDCSSLFGVRHRDYCPHFAIAQLDFAIFRFILRSCDLEFAI